MMEESRPTQTIDTGILAQLAALAGLDVTVGLASTGGNVATYLRLLRKFFQLYSDTPDKVRATITAGHRTEARRLAHTIKSSAATLGITSVASSAMALEAALHQGLAHEDLNTSLETALADATANILAALPDNGVPT
jgi:two-component system sensor histidine kinase/response regulator